MFFRRLACFSDVAFVSTLLAMHTSVLQHMRYLPWIALGVLVPVVLSPLMLSLWTVVGSGNANFLFFQGLCMWGFVALGLVEFTSAAVLVNAQNYKHET